MGQPVIIPKFDLPGDKPHWAVRAAWITGGLLLLSLVGLGAVMVHHHNLEVRVQTLKQESIARAKFEADAKLAAVAAAVKAQKEAELAAKLAAQAIPATTVPSTGEAANAPGTSPRISGVNRGRRVQASHAVAGKMSGGLPRIPGGRPGSKASSNKPDAIDELLRKMK